MFCLQILDLEINNLTETSNIDLLYPGLGPRAGQTYTLIFLTQIHFCSALHQTLSNPPRNPGLFSSTNPEIH